MPCQDGHPADTTRKSKQNIGKVLRLDLKCGTRTLRGPPHGSVDETHRYLAQDGASVASHVPGTIRHWKLRLLVDVSGRF